MGKSGQKFTITKTEITEETSSSGAISGQKEGKGSRIRKTTEKTISTDNNKNESQGRSFKEETTTKTTTTTTNQGGRGRSSGKEEITTKTITTTTNQGERGGSSGKEEITTKTTTTTTNQGGRGRSSGKEEITTKTKTSAGGQRGGNQLTSSQKEEKTSTTTTNQRQSGRGQSQSQKDLVVKEVTTSTSVNRRNAENQKQVTTTKTVTTATVGQNSSAKNMDAKARAAMLSPSQTSQLKVDESANRTGRNRQKASSTNEKSLTAQKSVPAFRGKKEEITKISLKEEVKRPLSSKTEIDSSRDNIIRITINDTGKIPKKTYVLNVRKLDRIQQNKRQRLIYSSNLEKNAPLTTSFNHNITMVKNIKRESPYVISNIPNTIQIVINESGKIPKKQVLVSPRKYEVIKSIKKPLKLTYENYVETNTTATRSGINKIPLPATVKKTEITKKISGEQKVSKTTETKTSRIRTEGTEDKTTTKTTTTTTTETKKRIGRNKSEANINKGEENESKVTVTKTEISTESKGDKGDRLKISRSGRNISENSGSITEKKTTVKESSRGKGGKVETVTTQEVITEKSGRKKRGGEEGSESKVTTVTKTEISNGSSGENGGRSRSRVKQETSSTTTTTTTKTVTKTSSKVEPKEGGAVVKKFRSVRHMKK